MCILFVLVHVHTACKQLEELLHAVPLRDGSDAVQIICAVPVTGCLLFVTRRLEMAMHAVRHVQRCMLSTHSYWMHAACSNCHVMPYIDISAGQ
jgi:hypothetical protein